MRSRPAPTPWSLPTKPAGTPRPNSRCRKTSQWCGCRRHVRSSMRLKTSGNTCARPISPTGCSRATTTFSMPARTPGERSSTRPAESPPSPRESGQPSVKQYEGWYQPSYCLTDGCPVSRGDGGDSAGLVDELSPGVLAGIENVVVALEHPVGEIGLAQVLPDVFSRIELRTCRRQPHHCEVFRHLEFGRGVPAGLVGNDHGVGAGRDRMAYLFEVLAHRRRVGIRHDDGGAGVAARADGAEQIGV